MRPKHEPKKNKPVQGKTRRKTKTEPQVVDVEAEEITTEGAPTSDIKLPLEYNPGLVPVDSSALTIALTSMDPDDRSALEKYQQAGKPQLSTETAMSFFQLFLNGYGVKEIHELNSAFPIEAIHWARIKYKWDEKRESYVDQMHEMIVSKVTKAQLETTNLMTDLLTVTTKKYGDKLKRYLQTGNEKDLGGVMEVASIAQLLKLVDGLQKITGQSNTKKHIHDHKVQTEKTVNLNATISGDVADSLTDEEAASVLSVLATAKRRKENA